MMTFKYIRPTNKAHGHTNVFINGTLVGYIMPDRSKFRALHANWTFTVKDAGRDLGLATFDSRNRQAMISKLMEYPYCQLCNQSLSKSLDRRGLHTLANITSNGSI